MRACLPVGLMVLKTATSVSKSTCENDESFYDSYGWTCRDYERAPYQCIQSTKYAIGGETALTSCCVCQGSSEESVFALGDSVMEVSNEYPIIRRASYECLTACTTRSESCSVLCKDDRTYCEVGCSDIKDTCDEQCAIIENIDSSEPNGIVTDPSPKVTSNTSFMQMIYILIGVAALLGICCCGCIIIYLIRNRVKTAVADPSPQYAQEQTRMVRQPYARHEGEWRGPDLYDPNNQISATPCQGGPVYNDY